MNYSKQRDAIQTYLRSVTTHPTAEEIYMKLRVDNPELSLGTVYRNLDKLSKSGIILRLKGFGEKDRFDGNINQHYHSECIKCGKVIDIFTEYMSKVDNEIRKNTNLNIVSHEMKFNIICSECK